MNKKQNSRKKVIAMAILLINSSIYFCVARADELSEKISTGMSKAEAAAIFGSSPDSEECSTIIGITKCNLVWKKGFIFPTIYSVVTVADKTLSVDVKKGKLFGLF